MKKILLGVGAVVVVAAAGFFGFDFYLQHKVESEVDAAFAQIRATGAKASHGKISFDRSSRTVTIADIATETTSEPPFSVKIASFTASGVSQPDPARFSADSIDVADLEVGAPIGSKALAGVTYKVPRIVVKDYSGPAAIQRPAVSSSLIELYRFGLAQLASITATSITIPNATGTMMFKAAPQGSVGSGDYSYSGVAIEGIKDGKIASAKTDAFHFSFNQPGGKPAQMTGDLANMVTNNIDVGAMAAALDPSNANDDKYRRIYEHVSAGPYVITSPEGLNMRIDSVTADDIGLTPSRLQLPKLIAMMSLAGAAQPAPGSAQAREMMETVANFYEGIHIGNTEMRGFSAETPQGPFKLQVMRGNFANGKLGEMAVEGVEGRAPKGPFRLGRFALKSSTSPTSCGRRRSLPQESLRSSKWLGCCH